MSATETDMRDFITALERETPRGLHPSCDAWVGKYFSEMRSRWNDPAAVYDLTGKIVYATVQELEFDAENNETFGDYREAYRCRHRAKRFAARFNQPCDPMKLMLARMAAGRPIQGVGSAWCHRNGYEIDGKGRSAFAGALTVAQDDPTRLDKPIVDNITRSIQ